MTDQWGRTIDYLRVSVTDRCNLRCRYCMPRGVELCSHSDTLRYEELLRVCAAAVALGVTRFKITGGEPLVRRDCAAFLARLKALPGVEQVTLTTNALLLSQCLDELAGAGVDGINISLDTLDPERYRRITGFDGGADDLMDAGVDCLKIEGRAKSAYYAAIVTGAYRHVLDDVAAGRPVDVRFIELMPIGEGRGLKGVSPDEALARLRAVWPDLHPTDERRGNGPAQYYAAAALEGRIGFIGAGTIIFTRDKRVKGLTTAAGLWAAAIIGLACGILNTIPYSKSDSPVKKFFLKLIRAIVRIYVEVFRGTPMVLQAVFIFYGLPYFTDSQVSFQGNSGVWIASLIVVSINTGAYMAESVRGGIISIDPGQTEGAKSIGMNHFQTMTSVILPQAIRNILPQIGNNYIINVKDTSVMFIIGFTEFFASHRYIVGINNKYFPSAVIEMAGYLLMTLIASGILRLVEKGMDGSDSYELVQEDPLTMTAGTYSHPKRGSNYDEQSKEFRERTEQELKFGRSRGDR